MFPRPHRVEVVWEGDVQVGGAATWCESSSQTGVTVGERKREYFDWAKLVVDRVRARMRSSRSGLISCTRCGREGAPGVGNMALKRRHKLANGFSILGCIGLLVGAFVIPDQWLRGHVRIEATVGTVVSALCVVIAAILERSARRVLTIVLAVVATASVGYAAILVMEVAKSGVSVLQGRSGLWIVGLTVCATLSFVTLARLREARTEVEGRAR